MQLSEFPANGGDYRVVAMTDIYLNGQPAKLLTIAARDEIEQLPDFPSKEITKPRELIWHICWHDDDEI